MSAYYSENDPNAAAWIRELIKEGVITDGEVDERSIEDIVPAELAGFNRLHFFAGIGVWDYALNNAGWPDDRPVFTGSCPCQPFSAAGKGEGFADERHLWPAWFHIIDQLRPLTIFGEQVSSKDGLPWLNLVQDDLEGAGYTFRAVDIPACSVGAPHRRNRFYFVAESHGDSNRSNRWGSNREASSVSGINRKTEPCTGEPGGTGDSIRSLADSESPRNRRVGRAMGNPQSETGQQNVRPISVGSCKTGILADTLPAGRPEGWPESGNGQIAGSGGLGELANSETSKRRRAGITRDSGRRATEAGGSSSVDELGDAIKPGLEGLAGNERNRDEPRRLGTNETRPTTTAGPTNGFWRDAEWIYCRDGKYRAVKPGIFPLVNGSSKGMVRGGDPGEAFDADNSPEARVMRLRGYGNAINAELATAFIKSYLDM